ncbi:MAG TPA: penicillin-binding transpeptidase domain-containing protein [Actinomycetota bacterium]|nr:penicillin-binding transpeptidase domain-containing protein [Actinomycetota bacterium]
MERQIRKLGLAFMILFAILFVQVAYVQVIAADRIAAEPGNAARQIRAEYDTIRGRILAADGTILAESVEAPEASVYRYERRYPLGELFGQLTGYYSRVYGRAGLEQSMNPYLAGTAPELAVENLADLILGRPKEGGTIVTTLVPRLQRVARTALGDRLGAVVALDPRTGDVLAMRSNPGYDPTPLSVGTSAEMTAAWEALNADPEKPLLSKAIQELYLPGSTFKLVTSTAALENGYTPQTQIPNPHVLDLPTTDDDLHNFGDELCNGGSRTVSLAIAFRSSCNVPFGQVGLDLGAPKLSAQAFDWGMCPTFPPSQTGCEDPAIPFALPFENGRFPEPAYFDQRVPALAYSAVGLDNDLWNPLHLALITAGIADGGSMHAPRLVTAVRDPKGSVVAEFPSEVLARPISAQTSVQMRAMMAEVVASGTGTAAAIPGVVVAGKTGTATNGELEPPNAWFTAFAPAGPTDEPTIAVAVIVLDGGDLGNEATGGREAAPIAKAVIEAWLGV